MSEYLEIGCTPYGENCVSVEETGAYRPYMRTELNIFKRLLERLFPEAYFRIKMSPHDFGDYGEVVVVYAPGTPSEELAYKIETEAPEYWDETAKRELEAAKIPEFIAHQKAARVRT